MRLRKLELKDAPLMLEWMHDPDVVENLQADFKSKTIEDCQYFIQNAQTDTNNLNLAVVGDDDVYMGTVSLKNVDRERRSAEFAISMRRCAMGTGLAKFAMTEIIRLGLEKGLNQIYWCVSQNNTRAVRFYDRNGYPRVDAKQILVKNTEKMCSLPNLLYYAVNKRRELL